MGSTRTALVAPAPRRRGPRAGDIRDPALDPAVAATAPARWLLGAAANGGVPLTQTHALARVVVPLNEGKVAAYKRLMSAETQLAELRHRRGVSQATIATPLEVSQPNVSRIEREEDVYLSTLARYVAALGGHLEVLAVFPDETVTVLREPDPAKVTSAA